jgi:hypothetical protein
MRELYCFVFCTIILSGAHQTKPQSILKNRNYLSISHSINRLEQFYNIEQVSFFEHYDNELNLFKPNTLLGDWNNVQTSLANAGIDISINYNNDFWENLSDGINRKPAYVGLFTPEMNADLDKILGWQGANLYLSIHGTFGSNFNDRVGSSRG